MTKMTEAMHYANIQEKMTKLGITDESVAKKAQEIGSVTPEEQKKAEEALWQESKIAHEEKIVQAQVNIESVEQSVEAINFRDFSFHPNQTKTVDLENQSFNSDKKDDDNNSKNELAVENRELIIAKNSDVQQIMIPKLLEILSYEGKQVNGSVVYQGEKYTVSIKIEESSNTLSLDRNLYSENREALLASKNNDEPIYSIIVNNITQEEFERFKLLVNNEQHYRKNQQAQQQTNTKYSDNELG
ncbi:hypothetical protein [Brasilonema sp. UFV-L1]|uniref:hypothetical protein n=1 Tax=Brasilonema sp. UFV-L1 TaxID=2234130 RepID=UPI00145FB88C|nr:hypothetical protein [Brasilonema sp. UFV-L1]NMG11379.1 hypothetical protein [Brasilonema sp. UFV-L1]